MSSLSNTLLSDVPRLIGVAIAICAALVAVAAYWKRQRSPLLSAMHRGGATPLRGIVYRDSPTVRVTDSQRVDRRRKVVRLGLGDHLDVLENHAASPVINATPRFRITLKRIVRMDDGTVVAHVKVDFGGAAVSCGPLVEELHFNEFALPRATRDEARNCVFHYQESGDALEFMRIKLRGVDMDADIAEIDVMQVSGHWLSA
jgi:hypothetical protein